jgi:hypothetical protein
MERRPALIIAATVCSLAAGYLLGVAVLGHRLALGLVSGTLLAVSVALAVWLLGQSERLPAQLAHDLKQREAYEAAVQSAPRLGELLVHKYGWISERDLARALARQRVHGRRIGEILVQMKVISLEQLRQALADQRSELGLAPELQFRAEGWTGRRPRVETPRGS